MDISRQINTRIRKDNKKSNKTQVKGACCTNNIVQKCLSFAVSLFLVLGMMPQNAFGAGDWNHAVDDSGDWMINTAQGLMDFREEVNGGDNFSGKTVTLVADLDLSSESLWEPIGTFSNFFKGTFDGNGHKITGLHLNGSQSTQGLFGYVRDATVKNLTLEGVTREAGSGSDVGGICGYCTSANISNCTVTGNINGGSNVGGICGYCTSANISNCTVTGNINVGSDVGGICGHIYGCTISNCTVAGTVTGSSNNVGGICGGLVESTISNCTVAGTVTGSSNNVGGICGGASGLAGRAITGCAVLADVSGQIAVGGICGSTAMVTNCYTVGNITGANEVGGIIGGEPSSSNQNNDIKSCFFVGTLKGTGIEYPSSYPGCYVGGISGYDVNDMVKNCVCLASKIEGTGDPDLDVIGYISAVYSAEKPGDLSGVSGVVTGNDSGCYYRADLSGSTDTSYDGEAFDFEPGWQQKIFSQTLGWDTTVWDIPDLSSPNYSLSALPTLRGINVEQNPKVPGVVDSTPTEEKNNDSQNSHPEWGEREIHSEIIHYVNAEGMTSVEISAENTDANGIVWLREESDGTAAWYGVDNSASTFESGSRFYVQWLNTAEHPEAFADIDEKIRQQVEENRGWLFKIGVIAPDGTRYSTLSNPVKVYVQIGDDWDKGDLQGFYVQQGADENVEVSYVEGWPYPEGTDEFGVMQLNHFSPYFIYDKDEAKSQNPATNDECHMFIFLVMSGVLTGAMFITFAKLLSIRRKNEGENYFTNTLI